MPSETTTQFDTENAFPWTSIATTIDSVTGETLSIRTVFDAGYESISRFEAGRLIFEATFGEQATLGFTFQITEYDEIGLVTSFGTTFADNTSVTDFFENGLLTFRVRFDGEFGEEGIFPWSGKFTSFDENGQILDHGTEFDNGVNDVTFFVDGVRENRVQSDLQDAKAWQEIYTNYDIDGVIENRDTVFDDGVTRLERFENGVRFETIQLDNVQGDGIPAPDGGAKAWQEIYTNYDIDGVIENRDTVFDDGVTRLERFENGVRFETIQLDNVQGDGIPAPDGGAKAWQEIYTNYDIDGVIENRDTVFDDGVTRLERFENGVRFETIQLDNVQGDGIPAPDGGAKAWQEIYTNYDIDGVIENRDTVFDDGVTRLERFENGVRFETIQLDNVQGDGIPAPDGGAKAWQEIYTNYDIDGVIENRDTVFDDGVTRLERFENGVRFETIQLDNVQGDGIPAPDGGAKAWQEIYTNYDIDGVIQRRDTVFDNGVTRSEAFEDGVRIFLGEGDVADAFAWTQKIKSYDLDGTIMQAMTLFDDGRETTSTYDDGVISQRTTEIAGQILKDESFTDGQRTVTTTNDVFDFKAWNSQTRTFEDDGDLAAINTFFDDNSITLRVFEEDDLAVFVQVNGSQPGVNSSPSWGARLTEYDDAGDGIVTEFDNPFELPQNYIDDLFI